MGRTLPSAAVQYMQFVGQMQKFKRGIGKMDAACVDDLLAMANNHVAEVAYAAYSFPEQFYILSMILEEHKRVLILKEQLAEIVKIENGEEHGKLRK